MTENSLPNGIYYFHFGIMALMLGLLYFSYGFNLKIQKPVLYIAAMSWFAISVFVFYRSGSFVLEVGIAVINLAMICVVHNFTARLHMSYLYLINLMIYFVVVGYLLFFELMSTSIIALRLGIIRSESIDGYLFLIVDKLLYFSLIGSAIGVFVSIIRNYHQGIEKVH